MEGRIEMGRDEVEMQKERELDKGEWRGQYFTAAPSHNLGLSSAHF